MGMALVEIQEVSHAYGATQALDGLNLTLHEGEVHAVCGENGAGKSTLNRILSGTLVPSSGTVHLDGEPLPLGSVPGCEAAGVAMVHQEPSWFPDLDAADNLFLMHEPVAAGIWYDRTEARRRTLELLESLGERFPVDRPLAELTFAQRQMVAIARALARKCRVLILDEPTASLSAREVDALFRVVGSLRDRGVTVLYVTHRLDEVFALADRVSVLRDGHLVSTHGIDAASPKQVVHDMIGRAIPEAERGPSSRGEPRLSVRGLGRRGAFEGIDLEVDSGEVVVLAGLVGAGRSEVARAIFGLDPPDAGGVEVAGKPLALGDPAQALRAGIAYLPEDRQSEGLHVPLSIRENVSMASLGSVSRAGWMNVRAEAARAEHAVQQLAIRASGVEAPVASLSGGNQQKVLLGKWLATAPSVLILDEPTRGVDVGAKSEVHRTIRALAAEGMAVLVISSDLPEVLALADRVVVMREGTIAGELPAESATEEGVLELALPRGAETVASVARRGIGREAGVALLLGATVVFAALMNPAFLSLENVRDMLVRIAPVAIVGCGLTLVVLAREIDISVGSLMGVCAAVLGLAGSTDRWGLPVAAAAALCLGAGLLGGLVNGLLVTFGRVPSIIATLATLSIFRGVTELLLGGRWVEHMPDGLRAFGTGSLAGLPYVVLAALAISVATIWVHRRTPFGRRVVALGSAPESAQRAGVPSRRIRLACFALAGLLAGVAALFSATQLQVVESGFGVGFELSVVAAVVVGGTSIRGGRGGMVGTLLGATLLGIVGSVLIYLRLGDAATYWERAIQGGFIVAAVLGDALGRRR
ncbi:MAG: ATP-binding cassette domain-containing protein [Fimbriimonadaceae bacterium]|nr:ATP-binding cassette domain-containing protein [Fimbriimonadaceae bacterium]